jgi:hypothetical protein
MRWASFLAMPQVPIQGLSLPGAAAKALSLHNKCTHECSQNRAKAVQVPIYGARCPGAPPVQMQLKLPGRIYGNAV